MRIEKTKNASRNITFGLAQKIYQIIVPFLLRTALIVYLGAEYVGLNSLFISILAVLNIAELGVGNALVFSMYKPIAHDDTKTICALMRLYKIYYIIIGAIVLAAGLVILPFIPQLIKGDVPADVNVYVLYLLNLGATVLSYWVLSYKNSILIAHQRTDVSSKVLLGVNTVQYALQFVSLIVFKNYYLYLIIALASQLVINVVTAIIADKLYPKYRAKGKLPKEEIKKINSKIKDLFAGKIGSVVMINVDSIVISAFLGLVMLGKYNNYYYVVNSLVGVFTVLFNGIRSGIGNSLILESKEKNYNNFKTLTFITFWIVGFCCACLAALYQPFMNLWVGDKLMLGYGMVVLFCLYFMIIELGLSMDTFKDAAGLWKQDKYRKLICAALNLIINLILIQFIGIYGILLSTVLVSFIVDLPWLAQNVYKQIFGKKTWEYFKYILVFVLVDVAIAAITAGICYLIPVNNYLTFGAKMIICVIVPNVIMLLVYHRREEFLHARQLVFRMIRRGK